MTAPLLVGVLGSRIGSQAAAQIGYGNRELDLYETGSIEPICDAGMLPVGVASTDVAGGLDLCDLLSALVVPHDGRRDAGAPNQVSGDHDQTGLPIVICALARNLPILAIGSGEFLVTAALSAHQAEPSADPAEARGADRADWSRANDDSAAASDLSELVGVSSGRQLPLLTGATKVPSGMRIAASGPDGSVYAVVTSGRAGGPALAIRWDPGVFPAGDQARDGPFHWLRGRAANTPPRAQRERQGDLSVPEEVR